MKQKFPLKLSATQIILLSFLFTIIAGSILLALPISSATGEPVPYIDALFTATTSVCVTGLVTVPTYSTWSPFAQVVILILIQVGGLGVVTILTGVMLMFHKRIGMGGRFLLQDDRHQCQRQFSGPCSGLRIRQGNRWQNHRALRFRRRKDLLRRGSKPRYADAQL